MDTIFAVATARGQAGVAIIRMSGPASWFAASALTHSELPEPRCLARRVFRARDGTAIDDGLLVCFAEGESFTGEQSAEFQVHGSPAVQAALLGQLGNLPDLRPAIAGEFTRRALENGRLDLSQVEGLGDLIAAETEAQRRQALRVMRGTLSEKAASWRQDLIGALAKLNATIDFADEDVPEDMAADVDAHLTLVRSGMLAELAGSAVTERIRDGFEVALVGRPNSGKSSLINTLAGRKAAITSDVPGTTRDVIEVRLDLGGLPVTVLDTAGLRESVDEVESLGIELARDRAIAADLRLFLLGPGEVLDGLDPQPLAEDLILMSKADLVEDAVVRAGYVSARTGFGIDRAVGQMTDILSARATGATSLIRERHRSGLEEAVRHLDSARDRVWMSAEFTELAAEDVRLALQSVDMIVGRVGVEDVLDDIFSNFCLGK